MTDAKGTILIVEDDAAIADGLSLNLKLEGFEPVTAVDGETALRLLGERPVALILLDITLPSISGLEVLGRLRDDGDATPVIVLSARQDDHDKVAALRLGADDYVTKPFSVAELLARIGSVLRRATPRNGPPATPRRAALTFADVAIDDERREVTRGGEPVALTPLEYELLRFLCENAGKVFTRHELLRHVWGAQHAGSPRTVDNFIAQLRTKLEADSNSPRHIVTVRGSGYRFDR